MKKNIIFISLLSLALIFPFTFAFASYDIDFEITASNALLTNISQKDGIVVYKKNADDRIPIGSSAKLLTAALVLEKTKDLSTKITVPDIEFNKNVKSMKLQVGEVLTLEDLLAGMLVYSANDATLVLAHYVSGTVDGFVSMMNTKIKELGGENTNFMNPCGLDDPAQYSTVNDIFLYSRYASTFPKILELTDSIEINIPATNMSKARRYYSTNHLISKMIERKYYYGNATGMNAGSTVDSGSTLVTIGKFKSQSYLCIVVGSKKSEDKKTDYVYEDATKLLEWASNSLEFKQVLAKSEAIREIPVTMSNVSDAVILYPSEDIEVLVPKEFDLSKIERVIQAPDSLEAPVEINTSYGFIDLKYGDINYGRVDLVSNKTVERSQLLHYGQLISNIMKSIWIKIFGFLVFCLVALYIALIVLKNRAKNRRRRRRKIVRK